MYGRVSWYDRNSNYNNYFGNLSTGEWFKFVSRQVALDHVYVMTPSTVLNVRYGYNWFVRGTDSNPENHDFDLTSLGFPASYNASIPDGIRRFPRFDITGYQGTGIGGEERPNETQSFIATLNKSAGAHSLQDRHGVPAVPRDRPVLRQQPDRPVQFRLDLDPRAARQLDGGARAASASRSPRSCSASRARGRSRARPATTRSPRRGASSCRTTGASRSRMTVNLGLRYEYETPLSEVDNKSVRGFDAAAVQAIEAAARAKYAAQSNA